MPEPCDTTDAYGKTWPKIDPHKTGPYGRCPRCGEGKMFASYLKLRDTCDVCALDYGFADPADGPAFFVLCFTCVPAVVFALLLEVYLSPPPWLHLLTSLPLILIFCLLPLRPLKGWLVASQFFFKAREARLVQP